MKAFILLQAKDSLAIGDYGPRPFDIICFAFLIGMLVSIGYIIYLRRNRPKPEHPIVMPPPSQPEQTITPPPKPEPPKPGQGQQHKGKK